MLNHDYLTVIKLDHYVDYKLRFGSKNNEPKKYTTKPVKFLTCAAHPSTPFLPFPLLQKCLTPTKFD